MRGRKISSAKRVWPVTFARASTLRRGAPITLRTPPFAFGESRGGVRESLFFWMRSLLMDDPLPRRLCKSGYRAFLHSNLQDRSLDGFENLKISGTPAQVAGNRFADLIPRRVRILIQQSFRGHQNCWRTIPALCGPKIGKSILQRMKTSIFPEAFHGQDLLSAALEPQHEARKHGLTV